jgi:hypothetical protein
MGLQASGALTPSQPDPNAALAAQSKAQQAQMQSMESQAMRSAAPLAQEQGQGYTSDAGTQALIAQLAGYPGTIPQMQQSIFGTPSTTEQQSVFGTQPGQQGLASGGGISV